MQNFIANKLGSSIFVRTPTEAFIGSFVCHSLHFNFKALPTFCDDLLFDAFSILESSILNQIYYHVYMRSFRRTILIGRGFEKTVY